MPADQAASSPLPSPDVCLLLRAHAEQRWLSREVVPVLRQLETPDSLPKEQLGAALAYLEVIWVEAVRNAEETDASHAELLKLAADEQALSGKACGYHASVQRLRKVVAKHVERLIAAPEDISLQAHAWR
ncbi:MAG TPA: hypothetical protein VLJ42_11420 [Solirubrobacteraceae bacterium]|nr:hypothetical protein [Solirubrobacteraceae bacterium]